MKRASPKGLVLEMFALRDIRPNEEVLLDYGPVWRRAWDAHIRRWNVDRGEVFFRFIKIKIKPTLDNILDNVMSLLVLQ